MRISAERLQASFVLDFAEPYEIRPHAAPTDLMPVIRQNSKGLRILQPMRWGLIPHWAKEPSSFRSTFNARSESLFEKPAFRESILRRRCLVPADGFIEWKEVLQDGDLDLFGDGAPKRGKPRKVPHWIGMRDRGAFAFAGLYDYWRDASDALVGSFTIVTGPPNERVAEIHDRMPIILPPERYSIWLDRDLRDPDAIRSCMVPFPSDDMVIEPL